MSTYNPKTCERCQQPIQTDELGGLCPACLLDLAQAAAPAAKPARSFGDYELIRQIGRGGMGVVYEARQVSLRRNVALKMILDSEVASPTARRRFAIEAETAAGLDHPNIVPIYEVGEEDDHPFFSMKLISGEPLNDKIGQGEYRLTSEARPLTKVESHARQEKVARLMVKVARAVQHAHAHGVLHRDLKPSNILIDGAGEPHLTDFGLAKLLIEDGQRVAPGSAPRSGGREGTPHYMSPEQASGGKTESTSDIFSLGVTFYELLTGQRPFRGNSHQEVLRKVVEEDPPRPRVVCAAIDRDLDTICMKCLEKDSCDRFGSAADLADDLERWLRHLPITARRANWTLRTSRWIKRNPVGAAFIATLSLGLLITGGLWRVARERQEQIDEHNRQLVAAVIKDIEGFARDTNRTVVRVSSYQLAAIDGRGPAPPVGDEFEFNLGVNTDGDEVSMAQQLARLLGRLEKGVADEFGRPVMFHLKFFQMDIALSQVALQRQADFLMMSPLEYLRAKALAPGTTPIARSAEDYLHLFVARTDTGITNLPQLAGHSVAFGDRRWDSTVLGQARLVQAGIRAANLSRFTNLPEIVTIPQRGYPVRLSGERATVHAILSKQYDGGILMRKRFEMYRHGGLVALDSFRGFSPVYVARAGLDPKLVEAFRQALLSSNEQSLPDTPGLRSKAGVRRFAEVEDRYYDALREAVKLADEFDASDGAGGTGAEMPARKP